MKKIKAAVVGYGNIGRYSLEALLASPDFELTGVVRRHGAVDMPEELKDIKIVKSIDELPGTEVAILAVPSRKVEEYASDILAKGICTVDSFDIHTDIVALRRSLQKVASEHKASAVISAGWDPGSDSVVRSLMKVMAPKGVTYTDFGPGMSMGHTVAAKAVEGVKAALSMTIPLGTGIHRRMVYVEIKDGYKFEDVQKAIKADEYFAHDETHVIMVDDVEELLDRGHGVSMTRKGVSGKTQNQMLEFGMRINNPALTGQILVAAARAAVRQSPGCRTLIEIPVIDMLPGEREDNIRQLV